MCFRQVVTCFDGFKRVNLTGFRRVSTGLDGFQRVLTRTHQECYVDFFFFRFDKDTSLFVSFFRFLDTITIFNDKNTQLNLFFLIKGYIIISHIKIIDI